MAACACWSGRARQRQRRNRHAPISAALSGPTIFCRAHIAGTNYTLDVSFPVDYPDQPPLTDFLTHQREEWAHDAVAHDAPDRPPYLLTIAGTEYRSGSQTSGTQSLVLAINEDFGAHPVTSFKTFNYDLRTGAPITFASLFKPGSEPLEVLNPIVQRTIGPLPFGEPGVEAYQNLAITDDAVIFFFAQGLLLPQVDGPHQVVVPRTELASVSATT